MEDTADYLVEPRRPPVIHEKKLWPKTLNKCKNVNTRQKPSVSFTFGHKVHKLSHKPQYVIPSLKITCIPIQVSNRYVTFNHIRTIECKEETLSDITGNVDCMVSLECLDISHNNLTALPIDICYATSLRQLIFNHTCISSLPKEICSLINIQLLDLSCNKLTVLTDSMSNLVNLKHLHLNDNNILSIPLSFSCLVRLRLLNVAGNELTGLPEELSTLTRLRHLFISNNMLVEPPSVIQHFKDIEVFHCMDCQLTCMPSWLTTLTELRELCISDNSSLVRLPIGLTVLKNLCVLSIDTKISRVKDENNDEILLLRDNGNFFDLSSFDQGVDWNPYLPKNEWTPLFDKYHTKEKVFGLLMIFNRLTIPHQAQLLILAYSLPRRYPLSMWSPPYLDDWCGIDEYEPSDSESNDGDITP